MTHLVLSFLMWRRYVKMSSPNMNNIILAGAIFAYLSIIFGGMDARLIPGGNDATMCKVRNTCVNK